MTGTCEDKLDATADPGIILTHTRHRKPVVRWLLRDIDWHALWSQVSPSLEPGGHRADGIEARFDPIGTVTAGFE